MSKSKPTHETLLFNCCRFRILVTIFQIPLHSGVQGMCMKEQDKHRHMVGTLLFTHVPWILVKQKQKAKVNRRLLIKMLSLDDT